MYRKWLAFKGFINKDVSVPSWLLFLFLFSVISHFDPMFHLLMLGSKYERVIVEYDENGVCGKSLEDYSRCTVIKLKEYKSGTDISCTYRCEFAVRALSNKKTYIAKVVTPPFSPPQAIDIYSENRL